MRLGDLRGPKIVEEGGKKGVVKGAGGRGRSNQLILKERKECSVLNRARMGCVTVVPGVHAYAFVCVLIKLFQDFTSLILNQAIFILSC